MDKEYKTHEAFAAEIKEKGLKRVWIAEKLGICPGHLTNMLKGRNSLGQEYIDELNALLKTKFK